MNENKLVIYDGFTRFMSTCMICNNDFLGHKDAKECPSCKALKFKKRQKFHLKVLVV